MQTRRQSLLEAATNTGLGFVGSWLITTGVLMFGGLDPMTASTVIVLLCTIWSLVRGYFVRRANNRKESQ